MISNKRQAIRKNGFAPIILIVVLALVIAVGGVGIGLAWRTNYLDKYLPARVKELLGKEVKPGDQGEEPREEPGEEPSKPEEDPTKDWKVYTNSQYGYSFKYPNDWGIDVRSPSVIQRTNPSNQAFEGVWISGPANAAQWIALYYEDSGGKGAEEFIQSMISRTSDPEEFPITTESKSLGGRTWVKATLIGPGMGYDLKEFYYAVTKGELGFYFTASAEVDQAGELVRDYDKTELDLLELVVPTFSFVD